MSIKIYLKNSVLLPFTACDIINVDPNSAGGAFRAPEEGDRRMAWPSAAETGADPEEGAVIQSH